jgi:hypothetical protein
VVKGKKKTKKPSEIELKRIRIPARVKSLERKLAQVHSSAPGAENVDCSSVGLKTRKRKNHFKSIRGFWAMQNVTLDSFLQAQKDEINK